MRFRVRSVNVGRKDFSDWKTTSFNINGGTLIVGDNDTGKTATGKIIDLCLGKEELNLPVVKKFSRIDRVACVFEFRDQVVTVARLTDPGEDDGCYFLEGDEVFSVVDPLNSVTLDALKRRLNSLAGFDDVVALTAPGSERTPSRISVRNWSRYLMLLDEEISDSKSFLHGFGDRASDRWILREEFSFLIGAYGEDPIGVSSNLLEMYEDRVSRTSYPRKELVLKLNDLRIRAERLVPKLDSLFDGVQFGSFPKYGSSYTPARGFAELFEWIAGVIKQIEAHSAASVADVSKLDEKLDELLSVHSVLQEELDVIRAEKTSLRRRLGDLNNLRDVPGEIANVRGSLSSLFEAEVGERSCCPTCGSVVESPSLLSEDEISLLVDISSNNSHSRSETKDALTRAEERYRKVLGALDRNIAEAGEVKESIERMRGGRSDGEVQNIVEELEGLRLRGGALGNIAAISQEEYASYERRVIEEEMFKGDIIAERDRLCRELCSRAVSVFHDLGGDRDIDAFDIDFRSMEQRVSNESFDSLSYEKLGSSGRTMLLKVALLLTIAEWGTCRISGFGGFLFLDQPSQIWSSQKEDEVARDRTSAKVFFESLFNFAADSGFQLIVVDHDVVVPDKFSAPAERRWLDGKGLIPSDW